MKYNKLFFLIILIILGGKIFSQVNEFPMTMYITSEEGLNVRNAPSLNSNRMITLIFGERVRVNEKGSIATIDGITDYWYRISYWNGISTRDDGWVFGGYLSKNIPFHIIDKIVYNTKELSENISFTSFHDYLGKWVLLANEGSSDALFTISEGNFDKSDSYFIIYEENGMYKFLTKYYHELRIGIVTWTEYHELLMDSNNKNGQFHHSPWSIVGKPGKKSNTHIALIDSDGPFGYFQRIVE